MFLCLYLSLGQAGFSPELHESGLHKVWGVLLQSPIMPIPASDSVASELGATTWPQTLSIMSSRTTLASHLHVKLAGAMTAEPPLRPAESQAHPAWPEGWSEGEGLEVGCGRSVA